METQRRGRPGGRAFRLLGTHVVHHSTKQVGAPRRLVTTAASPGATRPRPCYGVAWHGIEFESHRNQPLHTVYDRLGAANGPGETMQRNVGTDSVLSVLADTQMLATVDLGGGEEPPPPPVSDATRPQRYVVRRCLGMGGFGEVMSAFDVDLRRYVALKRIREDRRAIGVARLVEEAQVTAQIGHPAIPSVHALGVDEQGRPFFAMDLIAGRCLTDVLSEDAPTLQRKLRIFTQVANAVAFAHERGVIHRDIKPDNVMIGRFGEVHLMDWGIAKVLGAAPRPESMPEPREEDTDVSVSDEHPPTRAGGVIGTPGYMSPEQARGAPDIDTRSDIYALGALLYHMLAGRAPIQEDTPMKAILAAAAGHVTPLSAVAKAPRPLQTLVHRALEALPEDRYQRVIDMVRDVESWLDGGPVTGHRETLLECAERWMSANHAGAQRLRYYHIDFVMVGSGLIGAAAGVWLWEYLKPWTWVLLVAGTVSWTPFVWLVLKAWLSQRTS